MIIKLFKQILFRNKYGPSIQDAITVENGTLGFILDKFFWYSGTAEFRRENSDWVQWIDGYFCIPIDFYPHMVQNNGNLLTQDIPVFRPDDIDEYYRITFRKCSKAESYKIMLENGIFWTAPLSSHTLYQKLK